MQREITMKQSNIFFEKNSILRKQKETMIEERLIARLKKGEEQIKNNETTDAEIVFGEMRKKYDL